MSIWSRGRKLVVFSSLLFLMLASSSVAQVTISNFYSVSASTTVPGVHLNSGNPSYTGLSSQIGPYGSNATVNITMAFTLNSRQTINVTSFLNLSSPVSGRFAYVSNVTSFTGQATVAALDLYSTDNSGEFSSQYSFSSASGGAQNNSVFVVPQGANSTFGLSVTQSSKAGFGGPFNWYLNFTVDGEYLSPTGQASVFTQYSVSVFVTTVET